MAIVDGKETPSPTPGPEEKGGGVEALKDFKIEIEQGHVEEPLRKRGRPANKIIKPSQEEVKKEVEGLADMLIGMTNTFCVSNGLAELNPLQVTLLRTGLVGTAIKYNIKLDDQPELLLAGGAIWILADKYSEFKKIPPKEAKEAISGDS